VGTCVNVCGLCGSRNVRRFTELDCLVDGHKHLLEDVKAGERNSIVLLRRGEVYILAKTVLSNGLHVFESFAQTDQMFAVVVDN